MTGEPARMTGSGVRELLQRLESQPIERRRAALALLDERGADFNVYPLSSAQQRLWLSSVLYQEVPLYNCPFGFRLAGELDAGALSLALRALVRRHEMLRTVFFDVDGRPYQAILPEMPVRLRVGRLPGGGEEREALIAKALDAEARRPFDLRQGPLLRATVLSAVEGDHLLMLTLHHIVCDGWSMVVFFRELGELYAATRDGRQPLLRPPGTRYVDYARGQATKAQGQAVREQLRYWVEQLRGAPPLLQLPDDRPRPAVQAFRGALERELWPRSLLDALVSFCRRESVTMFIAMLAAFDVLVHRWTGREDILVGVPFANRDRPELEDVIGFFVNTLVLRIRVSGSTTFRELLRHVREVTFAAQAHQGLPFELLVEALQPDRSANYHPVFQLSFILQEGAFEMPRLRGLDVRLVLGHTGTSKFDVTLSFMPIEAGIDGSIEYDTGLFERTRARRMYADLRAILVSAIADPDVPVSSLQLGQ